MAGKEPCPLIVVRPSRCIVDEKFLVLVQNLPPGLAVTVHALIHSEDDDFWEAFGHYISDDRGCVNGRLIAHILYSSDVFTVVFVDKVVQ